MTTYDLPENQMTDAALKQLTRGLAKAEGQQLLETAARLNADARFQVPAALNDRCMALIAEATMPSAVPKRSLGRKAFRYLAAAVLVASLMLITAFAAVEEVRLGAWQLLAQVKGDTTYYTVHPYREWTPGTKANPSDTQGDVIMGYVCPKPPEGYTLKLRETFANQGTVRFRGGDSSIELRVLKPDGVVAPPEIDLTHAMPVVIHGYPGSLLEQDGQCTLLWEDTHRDYWICFQGTNTRGDVLLDLSLQLQPVDQTRPQVALGYQLPQPPQGFELANAHRVSNLVSLRYQVMGGDYAFLDLEVNTGDLALPSHLSDPQARDVTIGGHPAKLLTGLLPTVDGSELFFTELFWCDTDRGTLFHLSSQAVDEEIILRYASAIAYIGE